MRRRDVIVLLGGATIAWPFAARTQQPDAMRRIAVLMPLAKDDPQAQARNSMFRQALQELGWIEGHNVQFDYRWGAGDDALYRRYAEELVALTPDVILAGGGQTVPWLQQATRTVPVVFTATLDPVALGVVASLARPGGNMTGFINLDYSFSVKWLELLKEIAPRLTRVAVIRDPTVNAGSRQFEAIQPAASVHNLALTAIDVHDVDKLERGITTFGREPNGGLIITASTRATIHRDLIIDLAVRYRLPAIYPTPFYVAAGGLVSYGSVFDDQYRQAADYVNRILKGASPANLPVQGPTKYEMALNLKTAKALGLTVPRIVRLRADQVID